MGIEFSEGELTVLGIEPPTRTAPEVYRFTYPVPEWEGMMAMYRQRPIWTIIHSEKRAFNPRIIPDNIARAFVSDGMPFDNENDSGGFDMFGIEWIYVPVARGSMEKEGTPVMHDANDWRECVKFPDIDAWDWESSALSCNNEYLKPDKFNQMTIFTGWFERLISFMGFEGAAVAMIDEDQRDAVASLFLALSDVYIDLIDHCVRHYENINGFFVHDDWGSQAAPFFSFKSGADLIVPAMKKVTDHLHELGLAAELHSCGKCELHIENFIAAGWDAWMPQVMNDTAKLFEEYGDRIVLAVQCDRYSVNASEEEQRATARAWVDKYCNIPGKTSWLNIEDYDLLQPAFREELYIASRKAYSCWPED